jgi:hypothetical protein
MLQVTISSLKYYENSFNTPLSKISADLKANNLNNHFLNYFSHGSRMGLAHLAQLHPDPKPFVR